MGLSTGRNKIYTTVEEGAHGFERGCTAPSCPCMASYGPDTITTVTLLFLTNYSQTSISGRLDIATVAL